MLKNKTHNLKIYDTFFNKHAAGVKPWELRKNDRNFKVDDFIVFNVIHHNTKEPLGISYIRQVTYVFKDAGYGIKEGYCLLTLKEV